jgi:hypothetical protein
MAMTKVSEVTVGSGGAASIEFTGIAGTGKDLLLLLSTRTGRTNLPAETMWLRANGVSGSSYKWLQLQGNGAAASSGTNAADSEIELQFSATVNSTASTFANTAVYISNYTSSSNKSVSVDLVSENNATTAYQTLVAGEIPVTSAITSLAIFPAIVDIQQYSSASLYIIS